MPKVFTSKSQKIGETGEAIASKFLVKQGYTIIERNYTKKWGEIDIIAEKSKGLHFIEVKTISCVLGNIKDIKYETEKYRPEENMHPGKLKRLSRTIQTYLLEKNVAESKEWQLDLVCVFLDLFDKKAKVSCIENIIV